MLAPQKGRINLSTRRHNDRVRRAGRARSRRGLTPRITAPTSLRSFGPAREEIPNSNTSTEVGAVSISIVIPAFNEQAGIASVIQELKQVARNNELQMEVLVVDDGSSDATAAIARQAGARVVQHRNRKGYGASLNTGLLEASAETIVIIDADGTYPAQLVPALVTALSDAEMAVAHRSPFSANTNLLRSVVKVPLTWLSNYISGTRIPDLNSGMRAFRRDAVLPYVGILPSTFSWTTTITLSLLCDGCSVVYVPAPYRQRLGKSKFRIKHAALLPLLLLRIALLFSPLKLFVPLAAISLLYGGIASAIELASSKPVSPLALFAFTTSVLFAIAGAMADVNSTFIRNISRQWSASNSFTGNREQRTTRLGQHTTRAQLESTSV